jgi:hypothetical protein
MGIQSHQEDGFANDDQGAVIALRVTATFDRQCAIPEPRPQDRLDPSLVSFGVQAAR